MKEENTAPYKKPCDNKVNISNNAKGYPVIKRVAFHRKVNKHA